MPRRRPPRWLPGSEEQRWGAAESAYFAHLWAEIDGELGALPSDVQTQVADALAAVSVYPERTPPSSARGALDTLAELLRPWPATHAKLLAMPPVHEALIGTTYLPHV